MRSTSTSRRCGWVLGVLVTAAWLFVAPGAYGERGAPLVGQDEPGVRGGRLSVAQRAETRTLNPVIAVDAPSKEIVGMLMADLLHINRETQQTEPALAESWHVSADGRRYTFRLRHGVRFSDGHALDADDVVFSFRVYLNERVHAPQRDLLIINGQPLTVAKRGQDVVVVDLPQPYAAAERLFDGIAILPRHMLEKAYDEGRLAQAWTITTPPEQVVGAGPFRLKQYVPGARTIIERNPFYWKVDRAGQRLPYLDEVVFSVVPTEDAQVLRFQAGEADVLSRVSAENFSVLNARRDALYRMVDVGPGLEYNFLFFNLNDLPADRFPDLARRQAWFHDEAFRRAVSEAIDREAIVRLVYQGRATAAWSHVTPANKRWVNAAVAKPQRSVGHARELLKAAGFSWLADATLVDRERQPVRFSIVTGASNPARVKMATLIQSDLAELGISVQVVPLEFRAMLARVLDSKDYDAAVFGLASGDADPNPEMNVWLSSGATHVWHPAQTQPATAWEAEIDRLMRQQMTTIDYAARKGLYDRVQALAAEHLPIVCLASPNVLVGASVRLGNFRPVVLEPVTLWNVDRLFWRAAAPKTSQP